MREILAYAINDREAVFRRSRLGETPLVSATLAVCRFEDASNGWSGNGLDVPVYADVPA